ncbi:MAG: HAD family phosphatase [Bacteroidales bacterium]|nr:HAD family phosphatase [Bacteroidales bacterium]
MRSNDQIKGVVFDFNGTLLWDTRLHNEAWDRFLRKHDIELTDKQKNDVIHGKNNSSILTALFKRSLNEGELNQYIHEKESMYFELCFRKGIDYAPGAERFIDFLKAGHIPYAIATASVKENVDFYFDHLRLGSLIARDYIIYDNHKIKSKPDPEIFLIAINRLGLRSDEVVIFEDSFAGIQAAQNVKAGRIIIVNSNQEDYSMYGYQVITNFDQVDKTIFK